MFALRIEAHPLHRYPDHHHIVKRLAQITYQSAQILPKLSLLRRCDIGLQNESVVLRTNQEFVRPCRKRLLSYIHNSKVHQLLIFVRVVFRKVWIFVQLDDC
ncbi:hypothetical protein D3C78_1603550 [compost metagenome]